MDKTVCIGIVCSLVVLLAIILTEPMYNQSLYDWSFTKIPEVQSKVSETGFLIWELYSTGGLVVACAAPIVYTLYKTTT